MLTAKESFFVGNRCIVKGTEVDADDPAVTGRRHLFDAGVEQATAEPGEKRSTKRPTRKTTKK